LPIVIRTGDEFFVYILMVIWAKVERF